jgi:phospho-N-acetylmuramoyl-pentapeptide-transferase
MVRALVIGSAAGGFSLAAGAPFIALLRRLGIGKAISDEGPESHQVKAGVPTMGGLLFVGTIAVFTVATNLFDERTALLPLGVMLAACALGVLDDMTTLQGRERSGGHERRGFFLKEIAIVAIGIVAALIMANQLDVVRLAVPHFDTYDVATGLYVVIAVGVILATTSAAAVTDGLDGLLGGLMVFAFGAYGVIGAYEGESYLAVFCFTVAGALLGFLWYNAHPAQVIMGDAGALALGAGLATVALLSGWWLVLPVAGVLLVAEGLSVVAQIGSFRLTGRRVLRMAPLHHHFELLGWPETRVVIRFWLAGIVGAMLAVALVLTE